MKRALAAVLSLALLAPAVLLAAGSASSEQGLFTRIVSFFRARGGSSTPTPAGPAPRSSQRSALAGRDPLGDPSCNCTKKANAIWDGTQWICNDDDPITPVQDYQIP